MSRAVQAYLATMTSGLVDLIREEEVFSLVTPPLTAVQPTQSSASHPAGPTTVVPPSVPAAVLTSAHVPPQIYETEYWSPLILTPAEKIEIALFRESKTPNSRIHHHCSLQWGCSIHVRARREAADFILAEINHDCLRSL